MATLSKDAPRKFGAGGRRLDFPMVGADIIYQGAAVGLTSAGLARPLTAADRFAGFAELQADNADGVASAVDVGVITTGRITLPISGLAQTDVGLPVYASDDDAFSLSPVGGVFVGYVRQFESAGVGLVEFDMNMPDPWAEYPVRETIAAATKTLDAEDVGKLFVCSVTTVITLPATGLLSKFAVVNGGADGAVQISLSPAAADGIAGPDLSAVDNKDLINTLATARRGDWAKLDGGAAAGYAAAIKGTWAKEP